MNEIEIRSLLEGFASLERLVRFLGHGTAAFYFIRSGGHPLDTEGFLELFSSGDFEVGKSRLVR